MDEFLCGKPLERKVHITRFFWNCRYFDYIVRFCSGYYESLRVHKWYFANEGNVKVLEGNQVVDSALLTDLKTVCLWSLWEFALGFPHKTRSWYRTWEQIRVLVCNLKAKTGQKIISLLCIYGGSLCDYVFNFEHEIRNSYTWCWLWFLTWALGKIWIAQNALHEATVGIYFTAAANITPTTNWFEGHF